MCLDSTPICVASNQSTSNLINLSMVPIVRLSRTKLFEYSLNTESYIHET